jgi:flagellar basal-body rod protein FlgF
MQDALLVGLSRQMALRRELNVIANNIANVDTTGYKADGSMFGAYLSSAGQGDASNNQMSLVQDRGVWHDMSQGPIEHTGNPLDVAIDGKDAFLVVQTPNGPRYTRNGSLQINASGTLVTSDGLPVLGDSGPISFERTDRQISISKDGTISVREGASNADSQRGKLKLVKFADLQQLQKDGSSLFSAAAGVDPQQATNASVVQGAIEKSNVRGVVEISRMIEITRSYTQVANMLQQQNDLGTTAIDKLADVPA